MLKTLAATVVAALATIGLTSPVAEAATLDYVALGDSYSSGLGAGSYLGSSSCHRSSNAYPVLYAAQASASLDFVACSGARTSDVLNNQVSALSAGTDLVTITVGGNDVDYVGDLTLLVYEHRGGFVGSLLRLFWKGPRSVEQRDFKRVHDNMGMILSEIKRRAPRAQIVVATYPTIVPLNGSCLALGISDEEAALMREVGEKLVEVTQSSAREANVTLINMAALSIAHDACSPEPWVNAARAQHGVAFHPTLAGAKATAQQINEVLKNGVHLPVS